MRRVAILFALLLATPSLASPPSGLTSVWGQLNVAGRRGPVSGARVRLACQTQRFEVDLEADDKGRFARVGLPVGRYTATISCDGYASVEVFDIVARAGRRLRLDVDLTPIDEAPFARERRRFRASVVNTESATVEYTYPP
jgi:hypothetical protein